jgi:uncharacterized membrane protein YccC
MISDPGRVNLRKAARAAIVTTALFAIIVVGFDEEVTALFAAFASFAALVFCDFGGAMRGRARAYAGVLVAGAALVALGTTLSETTVVAALLMALVGFVVVYLGCLGGYIAASGVTVILAFVLAAMVPGPDSDLLAREVGWIVGVVVAGVAALVLWPVEERRATRLASATLADALADVLDDATPARQRVLADAQAGLDASTGAVFRPAGAAARDRALVSMVRELRLTEQFVAHLRVGATPEDRALLSATAAVLRVVAHALRAPMHEIDVTDLVRTRALHTAHLETWARDAMRGDDPEAIITRFDEEFPARAMSLRVLAVAAEIAVYNHATLVGMESATDRAPADLTFLVAPPSTVTLRRKLADHWSLESVRLRAALRAAFGLAVAVLIAKAFDIDHAFWVVLGTLSVLRSNALGTGLTALQAVAGALAGFAVASAGILLFGGDTLALWIALPITIFLAAYTPGAVHFVVGQASFTVFVVMLFNILQPEGWRTGLVRVEDIAIGVGISLVVGVLLWPRGARAAAVTSFAQMLRDGAALLTAALRTLVEHGPVDEIAAARTRAVASRDRAISALEDLTVERGGGNVHRERWIALLAMSGGLLLAGDGLARLAREDPEPGCDDARHQLAAAGLELAAAIEQVAGVLDQGRTDGTGAVLGPFTPPATEGLCNCIAAHVDDDQHPPVALLWAREFLSTVQQRLTTLDASRQP